MNDTIYIGIDPGASGAIAAIYPSSDPEFHEMAHSPGAAIEFIRSLTRSSWKLKAVIEAGIAMPSQSCTASAKYWECRGQLLGALKAFRIPILAEPIPRVWKPKVGLTLCPPTRPKKGATEAEKRLYKQQASQYKQAMKIKARDRARELYPLAADSLKLVKDADKAEALLLAYYGRLIDGGNR